MAQDRREKAGLLSSSAYDDDAGSLASNGEDIDVRESSERSQDDDDVFDEDYEAVSAAEMSGQTGVGQFFRKSAAERHSNRLESQQNKRPSKRHRERRRRRNQEESELMYEMEEGGEPSASPSRSSSESDLRRLGIAQAEDKARRKHRFARVMIHLGIVVVFFAFVYGAYRATQVTRQSSPPALFYNGTANFPPTTILISLDGFRADFLQRGLTPTLNRFITEGVSPIYMLPSFPSVTFPNHYTMVTGLYPESHGVVGNTFWDPELKEEFYYTHRANSMQPKWWGGEPLWVTAESQGIRTAIHMWPGSEAHIMGIEPSHMDAYNGKEPLDNKVGRILQLLDLPGPGNPSATAPQLRPQLIAAYVPIVDADGHLYGPNSTEIQQTIRNVDGMLEALFAGLEQRNLTHAVNVVVVSDHGMATTDVSRLVQLEDLIDLNEVDKIDGWPLYGLRPKKIEDLKRLYEQLKENTKDNPNLEVYLRDENMPERYHFSNNARIAPLWIVPKAGWAIVKKTEFDVAKAKKNGLVYHPRGLHGYDHEHPLMRAIFVARGPAFPHEPGSRVKVFQNTEVYNIICDSIGVIPKPNNGTLRLPLKPVGLHSDPDAPMLEVPSDPPEHNAPADAAAEPLEAHTSSQPSFGIATAPAAPLTSPVPMDAISPRPTIGHGDASPMSARPTIAHEDESDAKWEGDTGSPETSAGSWWQWLEDMWDSTRKKLDKIFGHKGSSSSATATSRV